MRFITAVAVAAVMFSMPVDGVAQETSQTLEEAVELVDTSTLTQRVRLSISNGGESPFNYFSLSTAIRYVIQSGFLSKVLSYIGDDFDIHLNDKNFVLSDESIVDGTLVIVDGNASIAGVVKGNIVIVDGNLELLEGSSVLGKVWLVDAVLVNNSGSVEGGVVDILGDAHDLKSETRNQIHFEVKEKLGNDPDWDWPVLGLIGNLILIAVVGFIGVILVSFGGGHVDMIAETARRSPGRSVLAGFAGTVLLMPIWLLGFLALIISIIGIPLAIAWMPIFPIIVSLAFVIGYFSVARNAGEWLSDSGIQWTAWIQKSNSMHTVFVGVFLFTLAFIAAAVISVVTSSAFPTGVLILAGYVVTIAVSQIGFGAVLLTRAGRRMGYRHTPKDTVVSDQ